MHITPEILRLALLIIFVVVVLASRFIKGSPLQTPDGLTFPIKPALNWISVLIIIIYVTFFMASYHNSDHSKAMFIAAILLAIIALRLSRMPGTITLGQLSITQNFWFIPSKEIPYADVMAIQSIQGGRMTRVMGNNRVTITHTANHCAAAEFQAAIAERTGKLITT